MLIAVLEALGWAAAPQPIAVTEAESKVLAAHRQGLRTVLLPRKNEADLDDVPAEVRAALTIVLVDSMADVLAAALEPVTA